MQYVKVTFYLFLFEQHLHKKGESIYNTIYYNIPCDSVVKNTPDNARDTGSIPGSGRYPGEGNGNPLQYSCLGNSMDRGAWWDTVHGGKKKKEWGMI